MISPWIHSLMLYPVATNGRFEAASESKIKNANQIVLHVLGILCFSQQVSGKIFDLAYFCVFPCFLNVSVIMSDRYFHFLPSNFVKTRSPDLLHHFPGMIAWRRSTRAEA